MSAYKVFREIIPTMDFVPHLDIFTGRIHIKQKTPNKKPQLLSVLGEHSEISVQKNLIYKVLITSDWTND